jgi:hypothetical protein
MVTTKPLVMRRRQTTVRDGFHLSPGAAIVCGHVAVTGVIRDRIGEESPGEAADLGD